MAKHNLKLFLWMLTCSLLVAGAVAGFALLRAAMTALQAGDVLSGALRLTKEVRAVARVIVAQAARPAGDTKQAEVWCYLRAAAAPKAGAVKQPVRLQVAGPLASGRAACRARAGGEVSVERMADKY